MAGIYGILLKNSQQNYIYKTFYNSEFTNVIREELKYENFRFGRSVLDKFQNDRFLYENDKYIVCFEGIQYSKIVSTEEFISKYEESGSKFISELKGSFCGFIFQKEKKELMIFNDILSSRVLYYYFDVEKGFAFASEMHVLSKLLRAEGISIGYNTDAIYSLALYGQSFFDLTIVKEIRRLNYGSIINYQPQKKQIKEKQYFTFRRQISQRPLSEIIEEADHLMIEAVREEWEKDRNNNYKHFGLISGGMDSRVNLLLARKIGFKQIDSYTYGNPDSSDVKIAQQIANENFSFHGQCNLNNGKFLCQNILKNYITATDGLTYFTPNAIIYNVFNSLSLKDYGLLHSGQLGDTATGGFHKPNYNFRENIDKIGLTGMVEQKNMLPKISFLKEIVERYNNSDNEVFTLEQRQINGTLMGDKIFNNFIDIASPFYDRKFLELMLSLPPEYRKNQRIYFEWLKVKHPELLKFKWEKIGLKPNNYFSLKYGALIRKYINGGKKYFGWAYDSMNPIETWIKKDPEILDEFDAVFTENIELVKDRELQADLKKLYKNDVFEYRNRFSVLTVLLGIRLHFYEN